MSEWQPIETAPRDGTSILLFTTDGIIEGEFVPGEWSEHFEYGNDYSSPAWVCLNSAISMEIEELPEGKYNDGNVTHWMPLPEPPVTVPKP